MITYPSSHGEYPLHIYSNKHITPTPENHRFVDFAKYEPTEKKSHMKLILKKPIQTFLKDGLLPQHSQLPPKSSEADERFKMMQEKYKLQEPAEPKNYSSPTKYRIEELIKDSKQLISQGSKLLIDGKNHQRSAYNFQYDDIQTPLTITAAKEFRKCDYALEETPKKKDAYKEFQRLETKLNELETKINVLKTKRVTHTSSKRTLREDYDNKPYSKQESWSVERNFKAPMDYSSLLQNIVTQVQPHSILPKSSLLNPKVNEKFQNCRFNENTKTSLFLRQFENDINHRYYLDSVIQAYMNPKSLNRESWIDHFWQTMQCINFVKGLEPTPPNIIRQKLITLPKKNAYWKKKTIIFDLDETLVHCNESPEMPCDTFLTISFAEGYELEAGINLRPYAKECLKELSQHYELIVFTASHESYANRVVDYIDPNHEFIQHKLSREHCVLTNDGIFIKDLRVIGNRNIEEMLIVDNAAYSFAFQMDNGVPILPYYNDKTDKELIRLTEYLVGLADCENLRNKNRKYFKLNQFNEFKDPLDLLNTIYKGSSQ